MTLLDKVVPVVLVVSKGLDMKMSGNMRYNTDFQYVDRIVFPFIAFQEFWRRHGSLE